MPNRWIVHVSASDVQFRILKSGPASRMYDRDWKLANISFNQNAAVDFEHVMTVAFKYGKIIDIPLHLEMDKFQVQCEYGRVTIISHTKRSTFCLQSVKKNAAVNIQNYLALLLDEKHKREISHNKSQPQLKETVRAYSPKPQRTPKKRSPPISPVRPPLQSPAERIRNKSVERKTADVKQSPSLIQHELEKENSTPIKKDSNNPPLQSPSKERKSASKKMLNEFRKAQAEVRHARAITNQTEEKENTTPPRENSVSGLSKKSFYGSKRTTPNFASEMDKVRIIHSSPSPNRKMLTPTKSAQLTAFGSAARRSLVLSASPKKPISFGKNNVGGRQEGLLGDKNNNDENKENKLLFQPLSDTANLSFLDSGEGFQNLGNTCYMNSALQSLFGLLPFQHDLFVLGDKLKSLITETDGSLLTTMVKLMKLKSASNLEKRLLLKKVKRVISASAKQFHGFSQHDAHEFLRLCLDVLEEEVIKLNKEKKAEESNNNNNPVIVLDEKDESAQKRPVAQNFSFSVVHQITCNRCKSVTNAHDIWYDLPLEIKQKSANSVEEIQLQDLVNAAFEDECIEYSCEKCKTNQATVSHRVTKLPRIIMMYLKRYSYNQANEHSEKLRQPVVLSTSVSVKHFSNSDAKPDSTNIDKSILSLHTTPTKATPEIISLCSDTDNEFDCLPSLVKNAKRKSQNNSECNNNNNKLSKVLDSDGIIEILPSEEKTTTKGSITDPQKYNEETNLEAMTEEDQMMLAMQLSLEGENFGNKDSNRNAFDFGLGRTSNLFPTTTNNNNNNDTSDLFSLASTNNNTSNLFPTTTTNNNNSLIDSTNGNNNNTTHKDANENITVLCRNKATNDVIAATKPMTSRVPSDKSPDSGLSSQHADSSASVGFNSTDSNRSFTTIGSTKLDAFLSDESEVDDVEFPVFNSSHSTSPEIKPSPVPQTNTDHSAEVTNGINTNPTQDLISKQSKDKIESPIDVDDPNSYHLVSVVSHKGGSSNVGHYVSDVLLNLSTHKWHCYDDNRVECMTEDEVLVGRQSTSYLLFYLHKDFLSLYK